MKQTAQTTRTFLKPEELLRQIPVDPGMVVADFGCGNGHYTTAAGQLVGGKGAVYAFDLLEESLSQTASQARLLGLHNVSTRQCDLEKPGSCNLPETTCDLVIVSSLLHQVEHAANVIREAYRILKTGGRILIVEWLPEAPLGPQAAERVKKAQARALLEKFSFRPSQELDAGSFHYALLYSK